MEHYRHFNENVLVTSENDTCSADEDTGIYYRYLCIALNVAPASVYIDRFVTPIWYIIGIIGNGLTIKIWSRRMRRSTSAMYLTILAITDLFLILLHILMELKFAWNISSLDARGWCQIFFMLYMFNQYMSPLLILGFTLERFISIALPFKSDRFARFNRAPIEISVLSFVALLLSIPQLFGWEFIGKDCQGTETYSFFSTWSWISDILIFCIFPITSLILNIFVIKVVKNSLKLRRQSAPSFYSASTSLRKSGKHYVTRIHISTLTLLCISFYRIITIIPVAIIFILQFVINHGDMNLPVYKIAQDSQWQAYFRFITAKKVIDEFGLSQYSCNIFIYLATAKYFRHELNRNVRVIRSWIHKRKKQFSSFRGPKSDPVDKTEVISLNTCKCGDKQGNNSSGKVMERQKTDV